MIDLNKRNDKIINVPIEFSTQNFLRIFVLRKVILYADSALDVWITLWFIEAFGFSFGFHLPKFFYSQTKPGNWFFQK